MDSDLRSLELPAFELDCRDWLVATPEDGTAPEEIGGAPVIATLSTALIGDSDMIAGNAVLSVGLLDEVSAHAVLTQRSDWCADLVEVDPVNGSARYVLACPDSQLALLAEFSCAQPHADLMARFEDLMSSFRWAA
jgi:hypothetical protein